MSLRLPADAGLSAIGGGREAAGWAPAGGPIGRPDAPGAAACRAESRPGRAYSMLCFNHTQQGAAAKYGRTVRAGLPQKRREAPSGGTWLQDGCHDQRTWPPASLAVQPKPLLRFMHAAAVFGVPRTLPRLHSGTVASQGWASVPDIPRSVSVSGCSSHSWWCHMRRHGHT